MRCKALAVALMVVSVSNPAPGNEKNEPDADRKTVDQPIVIMDRLTDDDARDRVLTNSAHKAHVVELKAGRSYQVDLMKKDNKQQFDPYLRIEDSAGKQLAQDDDSGGNLNARIRFTPA